MVLDVVCLVFCLEMLVDLFIYIVVVFEDGKVYVEGVWLDWKFVYSEHFRMYVEVGF